MASYVGSVAASTDDADASLTDTRITVESLGAVGGCRFLNVTIPQGSAITSAYVTVEITQSARDEPDLEIYGEDADNSATFSSPGNMPADRTKTSAFATWISSNLGAPGFFETPSIVSVVQEIVDRAGWSSGNAMTILFSGTGSTDFAFASADSGDTPAELTINYTPSGGTPKTIVVTDYLGGETNRSRQLDWARTPSDNAGFADAVSIGVVWMVSVADNLGAADAESHESIVAGNTKELNTTQEYAGFADNVLIGVGYHEIFVTDYMGGSTVHGPPDLDAPTANWMVSIECDIIFGCEADTKQTHTSNGSTVRVLAGHRYRR